MFRIETRSKPERFFLTAATLLALVAMPVGAEPEKNPLDEQSLQTRILAMARTYLQKEQLPQAENLLSTMVEIEPKNAEVHFLLGKAFLFEKKYKQARHELRSALQLAQDFSLEKEINHWLMELPPKFQKPQLTACLCDGETEGNSARLFYFYGDWVEDETEAKRVIDTAGLSEAEQSAVKMVSLHSEGSREFFDIFGITGLPTLVLVGPKREVENSETKNIDPQNLKRWLAKTDEPRKK
jgi:thioredoxin-like negative regulator of GroEL